jgi:dephospho-CoA kinase
VSSESQSGAVILGLTGGIASGKSTVGRMFGALGAEVVDADLLAREAVAPGQPAWEEVRRAFGPHALRPDGTIDRAWLAEQVFASEDARRRLNAIVHPAVVRELQARIMAARGRVRGVGEAPDLLVAEVPLLIEEGLVPMVDHVVLVVTQQTTQVARLMHDKGLTDAQAWARVRAQLPVEAKRPFADWEIDGEAPRAQTEARVREIWEACTRSPRVL